MLKILAFLTKRQDLETKAFLEQYETKPVPTYFTASLQRGSSTSTANSCASRSTSTTATSTDL